MERARYPFALLLVCAAAACGSPNGSDLGEANPADPAPSGSAPGAAGDAAAPTADEPDAAETDASAAARAVDAAPSCAKRITMVCSVGTACDALIARSNGCWDHIDASHSDWRDCSTNSMTIRHPTAQNWAFDDTNPNEASQDRSFFQQCTSGASGTGFEYMAYRGGWLRLPHSGLKAYFAELHASDYDVDDYYGKVAWQAPDTYPMLNVAPRGVSAQAAASKLKTDVYALCMKVADHGYFGMYIGAWNQAYAGDDPRIVAFTDALNRCTR